MTKNKEAIKYVRDNVESTIKDIHSGVDGTLSLIDYGMDFLGQTPVRIIARQDDKTIELILYREHLTALMATPHKD